MDMLAQTVTAPFAPDKGLTTFVGVGVCLGSFHFEKTPGWLAAATQGIQPSDRTH